MSQDWRIGLNVKPRLRTNPMFNHIGVIKNVYTKSIADLCDDNGIILIEFPDKFQVITKSEDWITA